MYLAIIGDIVDSKKINESGHREKIQQRLASILQEINHNYALDIAANFTITLGDEFQGLLCDCTVAYSIMELIRDALYPIEVRYGLGLGDITTSINHELAIGADGPAYYAAREMINFLKEERHRAKNSAQEICIGTYTGDNGKINPQVEEKTADLNFSFIMLKSVMSRWTMEQYLTIRKMELEGLTQAQCATEMGVNQSTVQRRLTGANYYAYSKAVGHIQEQFRELAVKMREE